MLAALSRLMTDQPSVSSAPGHATFGDVLAAIEGVRADVRGSEERLREDMRSVRADLSAEMDRRFNRHDRRLSELETWKELQEDAQLVRQGKMAVTLGVVRILAKHWQLVWALVGLVYAAVWMVTGQSPIGVGPVQAP